MALSAAMPPVSGGDTSMSYAARTRCIPAVIHNVKAIKII